MGIKRTRVCIIGAGAAGLCAARHCMREGMEVVLYEQQHTLGGTWVYSDEINVFSSLYHTMNTNLPKEIMRFEDLSFETGTPNSFVPHQEVLAYLERYAKPIKHLIKFNTTVVKVKRDQSDTWSITTTPTTSKDQENELSTEDTQFFDVIFVCNGHFFEPKLPECSKKLNIPWIHCHNYRKPENYVGQKVVVVGAGPSGCDISIQIAQHAKEVHLVYDQKIKFGMPPNIITHPKLTDVKEGTTLEFTNGESLTDIDTVIFCTGYNHNVKFLNPDDEEKPLIQVRGEGGYLGPLYQHMVHLEYPRSIFFIGLCWSLIPFVCFDHQVKYAIALIEGRVEVPKKEEMERFEEDRLEHLKKENKALNYFHCIGPHQWDYFRTLSALAALPHTLPPVIEKIYVEVEKNRQSNLTTYKSNHFRILDDESFEVIRNSAPVTD